LTANIIFMKDGNFLFYRNLMKEKHLWKFYFKYSEENIFSVKSSKSLKKISLMLPHSLDFYIYLRCYIAVSSIFFRFSNVDDDKNIREIPNLWFIRLAQPCADDPTSFVNEQVTIVITKRTNNGITSSVVTSSVEFRKNSRWTLCFHGMASW